MVRNWACTCKGERVPLYVDLSVSPPDPFRHGNRTAPAVGRNAILQGANGSPRCVCRDGGGGAGDVRSTCQPDQCRKKQSQSHYRLHWLCSRGRISTHGSGFVKAKISLRSGFTSWMIIIPDMREPIMGANFAGKARQGNMPLQRCILTKRAPIVRVPASRKWMGESRPTPEPCRESPAASSPRARRPVARGRRRLCGGAARPPSGGRRRSEWASGWARRCRRGSAH